MAELDLISLVHLPIQTFFIYYITFNAINIRAKKSINKKDEDQ